MTGVTISEYVHFFGMLVHETMENTKIVTNEISPHIVVTSEIKLFYVTKLPSITLAFNYSLWSTLLTHFLFQVNFSQSCMPTEARIKIDLEVSSCIKVHRKSKFPSYE